MSDKARELLKAVYETEVGADFVEGEDSDYGVDALKRRKVWQAIDAFLSDPIPAAREAALAEALKECQQLAIDRIRTVDEAVKKDVYAADALMGIATLSHRALSDTSPAAAALLAQGERLRVIQSAYENFECRRWDAMTAIQAVGAALAPGEEKE